MHQAVTNGRNDAATTFPLPSRQNTFCLQPLVQEQLYHHMDEEDILEDVQLYRPGGFHPVMPFDYLGDRDRFEVWTKLGQGTFGIVWLCYDNRNTKFCAIKILRDDISRQGGLSEARLNDILRGVSVEDAWASHVAMPTEHFWQKGPNGTHLCLVMPVLGPAISRTRCYNSHNIELLKNICFQLTEAMAFLHKHSVCHGDFRPANILFKTTLDQLTPDEMEAYMPNPKAHEIFRLDGSECNLHAPKYAIEPMYLELEDRYITRDIAIIDFGVAFEISKPPKYPSIPESWAAPEDQPEIDTPPGIGSDLWSLGITIFETLCGNTPFTAFGGAFSWSMAEEALGPVPEPYRSRLLQLSYHEIQDSALTSTLPLLNPPHELEERQAERRDRNGTTDFLYDAVARKSENLHPDWNDTTKRIEPRTPKGYYDDSSEEAIHDGEATTAVSSPQPACITRQLDPAAVPGAVDLLQQVLRWHPEDRVPAAQLLDHEWFEGRHQRARPAAHPPLDRPNTTATPLPRPDAADADSDAVLAEQQKQFRADLPATDAALDQDGSPEEADTEDDDEEEANAGRDFTTREEASSEREEQEVRTGTESADDGSLHDLGTCTHLETDQGLEDREQEPQDRGRRWWRLVVWVATLRRPMNGPFVVGMDIWETVWGLVQRFLMR